MEIHDHLSRIIDALSWYQQGNRQPAIPEPTDDFERFVNSWEEMKALQDEIKALLKPLDADERKARDAIAESLRGFFGDKLKEGVNNYELSNLRKLKFTHKVDRKIEPSLIPVARAAYEKTKPDQSFDDLLRVKYELAAAPFKKLQGEAATAVSRMLVTNVAAPTLEVD